MLVADDGAARPSGAVCCVSFGATGWIGALGVAPEARRRGLGRALTEAAIARLRERGAETVLLFATDMGRPLYERLGFVIEGSATAWRGTAGAPRRHDRAPPDARTTAQAVGELDRAATGEDARRPARRAAPAARASPPSARARLVGWAATRALRRRASPSARPTTRPASPLMAAAAAGPDAGDARRARRQRAAAANLRRWGFRAANAGERMRLGPPIAWRPERQFGLFNLFWG